MPSTEPDQLQIVAYATAHKEAFISPAAFIKQVPFPIGRIYQCACAAGCIEGETATIWIIV